MQQIASGPIGIEVIQGIDSLTSLPPYKKLSKKLIDVNLFYRVLKKLTVRLLKKLIKKPRWHRPAGLNSCVVSGTAALIQYQVSIYRRYCPYVLLPIDGIYN